MTASIRKVVEDAIAYNLTQIKIDNGYNHDVTAEMVLRRPVADMTGREAILMYPGPEDIVDPDTFGSNVWPKRLTMVLKWYYQDSTRDGTGRFTRLSDLERLVGLRNGMPGENLATTVDLTLLGGNKWGGMEDGQSDTWIAALMYFNYEQRINNPEVDG